MAVNSSPPLATSLPVSSRGHLRMLLAGPDMNLNPCVAFLFPFLTKQLLGVKAKNSPDQWTCLHRVGLGRRHANGETTDLQFRTMLPVRGGWGGFFPGV